MDEQSFLVAKLLELVDDGVEAVPVAGGAADAAVDNQVRGAFGHVGVEVVHQAAEGRFLLPALAAQLVAARRANCGSCGHTLLPLENCLHARRRSAKADTQHTTDKRAVLCEGTARLPD